MHLNQTVEEYFDTQAGTRSKWRRRNRYYHESLESFIGFLVPRGSSVLHIGADSASLLNILAPRHGVGIHTSARVLEEIQKQKIEPHITFERSEIFELKELFEYAIISDMLGYVDDVETVLRETSARISWRGRIVITQYSALWEPILRLASAVGLRMPSRLQNWISRSDLENFAHLAGLEVIRSGTRMIFPKYIETSPSGVLTVLPVGLITR